jgi:hypothetical protein
MNNKTFASVVLQASCLLVVSTSSSQVERNERLQVERDDRPQVERDDRPDLIVSDLRTEGDMLVLEIQNQGPGTARGTITASVRGSGMSRPRSDSRKEIQLEAPRAVRATVTQRIPLVEFGIAADDEFSMMFSIALDTTNVVREGREENNSFSRQLDYSRSSRRILPPRATYTNEGPLPDLVITDIVHDGPYLKVKYRNASPGATGADFLIRIESNGRSFDGNGYYRFAIPPGNTEQATGGFTLGLVGIERGNEVSVSATIDWEDRVRESDESNNQFSKRVRILPEATQ